MAPIKNNHLRDHLQHHRLVANRRWALGFSGMSNMKQAIEASHKAIAFVAGEMSLALTVGKVRRSQIQSWQTLLKQADEALEAIDDKRAS